jgi:hypothetical protein
MDCHCPGHDRGLRRQPGGQRVLGAGVPGAAAAGEEHRQRHFAGPVAHPAGQRPGDGGAAGVGPVRRRALPLHPRGVAHRRNDCGKGLTKGRSKARRSGLPTSSPSRCSPGRRSSGRLEAVRHHPAGQPGTVRVQKPVGRHASSCCCGSSRAAWSPVFWAPLPSA